MSAKKIDPKHRSKPKHPAGLPVTIKPSEDCPLADWHNLFNVAFIIGASIQAGITTAMVSGAVRALKLKEESGIFKGTSRLPVLYKQQTMIHKSQIARIESYLRGKNEMQRLIAGSRRAS